MKKKAMICALAMLLSSFGAGLPVQAIDLGSVLKVGGIGLIVNQYGDQVNNFLNKLLMQKGVGTDYATKVVPIISVGNGKYIGAVQVVGPTGQVDKVKAVGQLEGSFNGNLFRAKALVPLDSTNVSKLNRVQGVGVSAIIDIQF